MPQGLCSNPIAHVWGDMTLPKEFEGSCVRVYVPHWDGSEKHYDVIAGGTLPDHGNCSEVAKEFNDPVKQWVFSGTGYCGLGEPGGNPDGVSKLKYLTGLRLGCLGHDVCVWANCGDDRVKPAYGYALEHGYNLEGRSNVAPNIFGYELLANVSQSKESRANTLKLGEPICGKALSDTESAFGIGFTRTWCPPGLKSSNPHFGILGGDCMDSNGNRLFKEGVGTYDQMQREERFWARNPQLITW